MNWDEENRLLGINDNGRLHFYTYDHKGERALKSSGESSKVVINGQTSAIINHTDNYTAYISPYFVVNKGRFTKHYFEGTSRIVSKLGEGTFTQPAQINAGGINFIRQSALMQQARDKYIQSLGVPPGPPTQHGIYATPEYTGQPYPSIDWKEISQNQEPPEGWPRPPKFNPPGDVPGPPVQFGEPISPDTAQGGFGFIPNGIREKNIFFYHPDHLGSSSYITGNDGKVSQHTEYIAFGEILFDEHNTEHTMPYLFNGKELDSETGLYYYGARYLDSKTSLWLNTDPLSGYNPTFEHEHYIDGQHNGGVFNPMNLNTYGYTYQNPILYIDPNGKQVVNSASRPNIFLYRKQTFNETSSFQWINYNSSSLKDNQKTNWQSDKLGNMLIKGIKNQIIDKYIKGNVSKNPKIARQGDAKKILFSTLLKKASNIEVKYRLINISTIEGYYWYGDIYTKRFGNNDWDVINYKGKSENHTYQIISNQSVLQEGIFLEGKKDPILINNKATGIKQLRKSSILFPSKNDVLQKINLPLKNIDKRNSL